MIFLSFSLIILILQIDYYLKNIIFIFWKNIGWPNVIERLKVIRYIKCISCAES